MSYYLLLIEPIAPELFDVLVYKSDTGLIPSSDAVLDADRVEWVAREVAPDGLTYAVASARDVIETLQDDLIDVDF